MSAGVGVRESGADRGDGQVGSGRMGGIGTQESETGVGSEGGGAVVGTRHNFLLRIFPEHYSGHERATKNSVLRSFLNHVSTKSVECLVGSVALPDE